MAAALLVGPPEIYQQPPKFASVTATVPAPTKFSSASATAPAPTTTGDAFNDLMVEDFNKIATVTSPL
ncbi:hypothetical protein AAHA92_03552 [Salvia divinorum]|uniref:Uncharacterized protein n=1 Tax=Salvia divinorum TaxID=28513 RepID=A0ABD1ILN7_SALDI